MREASRRSRTTTTKAMDRRYPTKPRANLSTVHQSSQPRALSRGGALDERGEAHDNRWYKSEVVHQRRRPLGGRRLFRAAPVDCRSTATTMPGLSARKKEEMSLGQVIKATTRVVNRKYRLLAGLRWSGHLVIMGPPEPGGGVPVEFTAWSPSAKHHVMDRAVLAEKQFTVSKPSVLTSHRRGCRFWVT
ncbi:MAG: hypothetical protein ND866_05005 [Pyrinomonadaceae bacterium]|nr:hypothetical protein [Pyrinomonadaceae bacterium]